MKVLIASTNLNKAKEFIEIAKDFNIELVLPSELGKAPPVVIEDGSTYFENALIKAREYNLWSGMPVISDDSGLEVEILDRQPGIFSARYGGDISQEEKNKKIIEEVKKNEINLGLTNRKAYFCCSVVLYFSESKYFHENGELGGSILDFPQGNGGFGYDPIVLIDSLGKTLAEIDFNTTTQVSFRAVATRKLFIALDS